MNNNTNSLIDFSKTCHTDDCGCEGEDCLDRVVEYIESESIHIACKFIIEVESSDKEHKGWERIRIHIDSGAVDTVGPKSAGRAFPIKPTKASREGNNYIAANGSPIKNYGERLAKGETEHHIEVSMPIQRADVKRVLMSTHNMNQTGLKVVLDGMNSYFVEKHSGKSTPITYEYGKYYFDAWVPGINTPTSSSITRKNEKR